MVSLFKFPTVRSLAHHLGGVESKEPVNAAAGQTTARSARVAAQASRSDLRRANRDGGRRG
jgi:hypothetical protein